MYDLPKRLDVCGTTYEIRSDYRAVLDICAAFSDCDLTDQEKALVALQIMYVDFEAMPPVHYEEALKQCLWFIDLGEEEQQTTSKLKLMDWEQDFKYIGAPVNRVVGQDIRSAEYLHWWSFIAAYYEIGECLFAQIVSIRSKKEKGKKLDKSEQEWYRNNRHLVDMKQRFSESEKEVLDTWVVK